MYWKSLPWLAVQCKHGEGGILSSQQWRGGTASILNLTFPLEPVSLSPLLRIRTQVIINSGISTFLWRTYINCPFLLPRPTKIIRMQCLSKNLWARYKIRPGQRASGVTSGNLLRASQIKLTQLHLTIEARYLDTIRCRPRLLLSICCGHLSITGQPQPQPVQIELN